MATEFNTGSDASLNEAVKSRYEANADTNAFTDAEKAKLGGVAPGAEVNAVDSVNGATGAVSLNADDIDDAATTNKFATAAELSKLSGIEAGATADMTGAEIKAAYQVEPNAYDDNKDSILDDLELLRNFDPDSKVDVSALDFFVDDRVGDKTAVRLAVPVDSSVLWPANPDNLPPDNMEPRDGWAGYAQGTLLKRDVAANTDLDAGDMGAVIKATAAITVTIRELANHAIPRSTGHYYEFAIHAKGGDVTIAGEAGVTLIGDTTVTQGNWALISSDVDDEWEIS